jgi:hypothetical protein
MILYFDADGLLFNASQNQYFFSARAKCVRYFALIDTEELICDSDSEDQCVSQDCDVGDADDLSDDSDNSVLTRSLVA